MAIYSRLIIELNTHLTPSSLDSYQGLPREVSIKLGFHSFSSHFVLPQEIL